MKKLTFIAAKASLALIFTGIVLGSLQSCRKSVEETYNTALGDSLLVAEQRRLDSLAAIPVYSFESDFNQDDGWQFIAKSPGTQVNFGMFDGGITTATSGLWFSGDSVVMELLPAIPTTSYDSVVVEFTLQKGRGNWLQDLQNFSIQFGKHGVDMKFVDIPRDTIRYSIVDNKFNPGVRFNDYCTHNELPSNRFRLFYRSYLIFLVDAGWINPTYLKLEGYNRAPRVLPK